jgi:predicted O-linked N-acetylglucosamine transferase (SPINDLY family)
MIADRIVASDAGAYSEKIAALPDSYFPNDTSRLLGKCPTRADAGLPQDGFVFCSFNNNWKLTEPVFAIWMRLLGAVPGSVLWLKQAGDKAKENLLQAAAKQGIAPQRLIFAKAAMLDVHLARHQLADLFLDTLPYNAHATACDALWAGLPVLTRKGTAFAGRVGASLLTAVGLTELITETDEEYEALALALAQDPARLGALREKLAANRATAPLFDTARLTRNLEAAYAEMLAAIPK